MLRLGFQTTTELLPWFRSLTSCPLGRQLTKSCYSYVLNISIYRKRSYDSAVVRGEGVVGEYIRGDKSPEVIAVSGGEDIRV